MRKFEYLERKLGRCLIVTVFSTRGNAGLTSGLYRVHPVYHLAVMPGCNAITRETMLEDRISTPESRLPKSRLLNLEIQQWVPFSALGFRMPFFCYFHFFPYFALSLCILKSNYYWNRVVRVCSVFPLIFLRNWQMVDFSTIWLHFLPIPAVSSMVLDSRTQKHVIGSTTEIADVKCVCIH